MKYKIWKGFISFFYNFFINKVKYNCDFVWKFCLIWGLGIIGFL